MHTDVTASCAMSATFRLPRPMCRHDESAIRRKEHSHYFQWRLRSKVLEKTHWKCRQSVGCKGPKDAFWGRTSNWPGRAISPALPGISLRVPICAARSKFTATRSALRLERTPTSREIVLSRSAFANRSYNHKKYAAPIVRGIYKNPCTAEICSYRVLQMVGMDRP